MNKRPIKDICDLFTGVPFSNRDFSEAGDIAVVQLRDAMSGQVNLSGLKRTNIPVPPNRYLKQGDVLFKARGHALEAFAVREQPSNTIVTNGFIVLRSRGEVEAQYLAWALNQVNFDRMTQQTASIKSVSIRDLRDLELPVPDKAAQQKTVTILNEIQTGRQLAQTYFDEAETYLRGSVFKS